MTDRRFFSGRIGLGISVAVAFAIAGALIIYVVKVAYVQPSSPDVTNTKGSINMGENKGVGEKASADENAAAGQVASYTQGLDSYHIDVKEYPHTLKPLSASAITGWHGPYRRGFTKDPWGHDWMYVAPGKHNPNSYDIWSVGPDGVDGTADDIGNWESNRT